METDRARSRGEYRERLINSVVNCREITTRDSDESENDDVEGIVEPSIYLSLFVALNIRRWTVHARNNRIMFLHRYRCDLRSKDLCETTRLQCTLHAVGLAAEV